MRMREIVVGTAMLTISLVASRADSKTLAPEGGSNEDRWGPQVVSRIADGGDSKNEIQGEINQLISAVPSPLISGDEALGSAYFNTLMILSAKNECSDFYGGPAAAAAVFKEMVSRLRKGYFEPAIGMSMSGDVVNISSLGIRAEYRLFDKLTINANGAFYRRQLSFTHVPLAGVGTFAPNTKEVRVLMFLHELGHVMKGEDGSWLLPNDGGNEALSRQNSQKIENVCRKQIERLEHSGQP